MTIEELKNKLISEAQASWNKLNITKRVCGSEFSYYDGYVDCGFIKEEQISELKNRIEGYKNQIFYKEKALDKVKRDRDRIVHRVTKDKKRLIRRNIELKAQVEKMKCCENCKYNSYWGNELHCNYGLKEALQEDKLVECKNMDKWEIKENDR